AAINNRLATQVASPVSAAFISFFVGTIALFVYLLLTGTPLSNLSAAKDAPPIAWIGGLLGAFFVTASVMLVPRLGVAMTFSLIAVGQMAVTLFLDHFGFRGLPVKEISLALFFGICLFTLMFVLIRSFV